MSRRKLFDIDLPPEAPAAEPAGQGAPTPGAPTPGTSPPGAPERKSVPHNRGPMASAVRDTANSLRARAEIEAGIRAENDALAAELVRLRAEGLAVERVPLDLIDTEKLVRDRRVEAEPQVQDLKRSLLDVGLSNPIRVERAGARFELIQGWRRLQAFRELLEETEEPHWAAIPAAVEPEGGDLETAYRRMVDENLVREDISFAEMAELARRYAADPRTEAETAEDAVTLLYLSASAQKRSYIRAFAQLLEMAGDVLLHPQALPRALGLELRRALQETGAEGIDALRQGLAVVPGRGPEDEAEMLRLFLATCAAGSDSVLPPEGAAGAWDGAVEAGAGQGARAGVGPGAGPGAGSAPASPTPRADALPPSFGRVEAGPGLAARAPQAPPPVEVRVALPGEPRSENLRCTLRGGRVELSGPLASPGIDEDRLRRAVLAFYATLMD